MGLPMVMTIKNRPEAAELIICNCNKQSHMVTVVILCAVVMYGEGLFEIKKG